MAIDVGLELRSAREAKGLSIASLAQRIRVQPRTLSAIELNDLTSLPPRPFGRGFVRAYAEEVDLDPDRTVHSFFSQFPNAAPAPPTSPRPSAEAIIAEPSPLAGLGSAIAILLVVVTAAVVLGRRNDPAERDGVGTSGSSPPAASTAAVAPPAAVSPAPVAATAPPAAAPLRVSFTVTRACWVAATADGQRTLYRTLQPNESQTIDASDVIALRFGDAGAVQWTVNGRQGSTLGADGAVRNLTITPENVATIQ